MVVSGNLPRIAGCKLVFPRKTEIRHTPYSHAAFPTFLLD